MRRRRKRKHNPSGFWDWASKHWFLTFLLGLSALGTIEVLVRGRDSRVGMLLLPKKETPKEPEVRPEDIPLMPIPPNMV